MSLIIFPQEKKKTAVNKINDNSRHVYLLGNVFYVGNLFETYIVSPTYGPYFKIHEIKSMVLVFQIQIAQKLENKCM